MQDALGALGVCFIIAVGVGLLFGVIDLVVTVYETHRYIKAVWDWTQEEEDEDADS